MHHLPQNDFCNIDTVPEKHFYIGGKLIEQ